MFRTTCLLGTTLVCLAIATLPVAGQGGSPARSTRESATDTAGYACRCLRHDPGQRADLDERALANAFVRVRDARAGQIVEWQVTDDAGLFAFHSLDPGSYIVEIVGPDETSVLAASQVLNVGAGQSLSTIVKLPYQSRGLASIFGDSSRAAAATITSQAAASGVTGDTDFRRRDLRHPSVADDGRADSNQPRSVPASGSGSTPTVAPRSQGMNYSAANDEIHILDRLAVIYRYRRIAVAVFVLASAAMMIQGYSNIQVYQAQGPDSDRGRAIDGRAGHHLH